MGAGALLCATGGEAAARPPGFHLEVAQVRLLPENGPARTFAPRANLHFSYCSANGVTAVAFEFRWSGATAVQTYGVILRPPKANGRPFVAAYSFFAPSGSNVVTFDASRVPPVNAHTTILPGRFTFTITSRGVEVTSAILITQASTC